MKFFRSKRQSFLMENKTGKLAWSAGRYLKYALGEIVLVVIGILIALQINNWNIDRLNLKEEKISLQAISEKIKFNKFQHEIGINRNKAVIHAAEELLILMSDSSAPRLASRIEQNLNSLTKRFLMGKSNTTSIYDELVAEGLLSNISSPELRIQLTDLKANMQLLESYEDLQVQFVDGFLSPFLNTHIDRLPVGVTGSKTDSTLYDKLIEIDYSAFKRKKGDQSYEELLKSRAFSNLMLDLIKHTKTLLPIYSRIGINISRIDSLVMDSKHPI